MYILIHILWNLYIHLYAYCTEGILTLVHNDIIAGHNLNWTVHHTFHVVEETGKPGTTFARKLFLVCFEYY